MVRTLSARHIALHCKMRPKRFDLRRTQVARMALAEEQNETPNPLHILRRGTNAVMLYANPVTYLIELFGGWEGRCVC